MTFPKAVPYAWAIWLAAIAAILTAAYAFAQTREQVYSIQIHCDDKHCVVRLEDVQMMARYIGKLEAECSAKSI